MRVRIRCKRERIKKSNRKEKHFNTKNKILDSERDRVGGEGFVGGDGADRDEDSEEDTLPFFLCLCFLVFFVLFLFLFLFLFFEFWLLVLFWEGKERE